MAHFAELDEDNIVLRTIVVHNDVITKDDGNEDESLGVTFLKDIFGDNTNWKQTSYNAKFRGTFAGKGAVYHEEKDIFYFPSVQRSKRRLKCPNNEILFNLDFNHCFLHNF